MQIKQELISKANKQNSISFGSKDLQELSTNIYRLWWSQTRHSLFSVHRRQPSSQDDYSCW